MSFDRQLLFMLVIGMLMLVLWSVPPSQARDRDEPYVPEIIEIEQPHAWCYILKNRQNSLVGHIHIMSCVPKGTPECNLDVLSLEEPESD